MVLRQGDYNFLEAESGEQALQIMETQRVDLLLLDLMMPHPNGFDVILTMRKSETLARSPSSWPARPRRRTTSSGVWSWERSTTSRSPVGV